MKHLFPFLVTLWSISSALAQTQPDSFSLADDKRYTEIITFILRQQSERQQSKTTAPVHRFVAIASPGNNNTRDSIRLVYGSYARGGNQSPKIIGSYFDNWLPEPSLSLYNQVYRGQMVFADSIVSYSPSSVNPITTQRKYTYDANNRTTQLWLSRTLIGYPPYYYIRYDLSYPTVIPKVVEMKYYLDTTYSTPGPGPVSFIRNMNMKFNSQDQPISDSAYTYPANSSLNPLIEVCKYNYNSLGQLSTYVVYRNSNGASWDTLRRVYITYTSNNLVKTAVTYNYASGQTSIGISDSFGYAGNNVLHNYRRTLWAFAGNNTYELGTMNSAGNWDTLRTYKFNTTTAIWEPFSMARYTYNSFDNIETTTGYSYNNNTGVYVPGVTHQYYYETYDPASVSTVQPKNFAIQISPNPVSSILKLSWEAKNVQSYQVLDAMGRLVMNGVITNSAQNMSLDVSRLPSGIYWLSVAAKDHKSGARFTKK